MEQTIGVLGQAVLVLTALVLLVFLCWALMIGVREIKKQWREIRRLSNLPYTDAYLPPPFDRR
jgi:hypothetical protein